MHPCGDREPSPAAASRGDHVMGVVRAVGAHGDQPAPAARLGGDRRGQWGGHDGEQRVQPFDPGVPVSGALFGVPVGGLDGVVDVEVAGLVSAGIGAFLAKAVRNRAATASSCRTCPRVNVRRNVPSVEGAQIPVKSRPIPPWRSRSMASMLSAPATIPATRPVTFRCAFALPSPFRVRCRRPVSSARHAAPAPGSGPARRARPGWGHRRPRRWPGNYEKLTSSGALLFG
jgi:hypothetical protein